MKSQNKFILLLIILSIALLSGCSFEYIPPATKGKILTTSGYNADTLPPGKYLLWGRDEMILLQTNTSIHREKVYVILQDKLTLEVDVRFRGRIGGSDEITNAMFNDIIVGEDKIVNFLDVYNIYGKMIVRNKYLEIISRYSVVDVHKNYKQKIYT